MDIQPHDNGQLPCRTPQSRNINKLHIANHKPVRQPCTIDNKRSSAKRPPAAGAHAKPCAMHACAVQECTRPDAESVQPKMYYRHGKACFSATCGKHQMSLLCGILTTNTVCHVPQDATLRPAFAGIHQMHTFNPISRQTSCSNSFSGC